MTFIGFAVSRNQWSVALAVMCPCMRSSPCFALPQLKDKAEAREKERIKMEEKKAKKRESSFRQLLKAANPALTAESKWEEVHEPIVY